jgi:pilus assembly protein CpaC
MARLCGFWLAVLVFIAAAAAQAETARVVLSEGETVARISEPVNKSHTQRLDRGFAEVLVGSADIADILPLTDRSIYVLGQQPGTTNISIVDSERRILGVIEVEVTLDIDTVQRRIHEATGNPNIRVSANHNQLVLSGPVGDSPSVDRAIQIASQFAPGNVINALDVTKTQQVLLKVRFVEASRHAGRELGVRWDAQGRRGSTRIGAEHMPTILPIGPDGEAQSVREAVPGDFIQNAQMLLSGGNPMGVVLANLVNRGLNIDVLIQALEDKGHVRNLAEPNLVALSGDTASFLAGGEFPYTVPTASDEPPAVQFKEFGVRLSFTPTVLRDGHINLILEPEVSSLGQLTAAGPVINSRRARTTIELRDGQSFAIAGLLQNVSAREIRQLPWLGSIPVLGALFRSTHFQSQETDLVIIVTPHLVRPGAPGDDLRTPFDRSLPPNDPELFLMGQLEIPKEYRHYIEAGVGIQGPYGHMLHHEFGHVGPVAKSKELQ